MRVLNKKATPFACSLMASSTCQRWISTAAMWSKLAILLFFSPHKSQCSVRLFYFIFVYFLNSQLEGSQQQIRAVDFSRNSDLSARLFSQTTIGANMPLHAHIKTLPSLMKFVNGSHSHVSTSHIRGSRRKDHPVGEH